MNVRDEHLEQLTAYLDGELDDAGRREVEALLARDPAAKALLESLRQTAGLVAALPRAAAPRDLAAKIHDRMARSELLGNADDEPIALARTLVWMNRLAVAACVALICTASWLGLRRSVTQPPVEVALNEPRDKSPTAPDTYKKTPAPDEHLAESKSGASAVNDKLAWAGKGGRLDAPASTVSGEAAETVTASGFAKMHETAAKDVPPAKFGQPLSKSGEPFGTPGAQMPVQTLQTDASAGLVQGPDPQRMVSLVRAERPWGDFERRINETGVSNEEIRKAKVDTFSNVVICKADNEAVHEQLVRKVADFATGNRIPDAATERLPEPVQARQPFYYVPRAGENFARTPQPNETWVVMQVPETKLPELMNELKAVAEYNRAQVQTEVNACRVDTPEEATQAVAWNNNNNRNLALSRDHNPSQLSTNAASLPENGRLSDHDSEAEQSARGLVESEPTRSDGTVLADASGDRKSRDVGRIVSDATNPAKPADAPKEKSQEAAKSEAAAVQPSGGQAGAAAGAVAGGRSTTATGSGIAVGAAPPPGDKGPAGDRIAPNDNAPAGNKLKSPGVSPEKSERAAGESGDSAAVAQEEDRDNTTRQEKTPVADPAVVRRADQSPPARNAKAAPNGIGGGAGKGDEAIAREEDAKPEEKLALGQTRREAARGKAAPSAKAAAPPPPSGASVPPPKSDAPPPPTVRTGPISAPGAQVQTGPTAGQTVNPSDNLPTGPTQTYRAPASANLQQSQNRGTGTQTRQQTFDDAPAEGCVTLSICIQGPPGTSNALNNLNPANAAPVFGPQLPPTTQNARPVQNAAPPGQTANPGILSPAGRTTAPATSNPAAGARRD